MIKSSYKFASDENQEAEDQLYHSPQFKISSDMFMINEDLMLFEDVNNADDANLKKTNT